MIQHCLLESGSFIYFAVYSDERTRAALAELLPIPNRMLIAYDVTLDDVERNVIDIYRDLSGTAKGIAILK